MEKFRSRVFTLVLYSDDVSHLTAIQKIHSDYDYLAICHNNDFKEDRTLKKEHYHYVLKFKNAIWNTSLSKELGIELNYIQNVRSYKNTCLYLLHYNDKDKTQYDYKNVFGSLKNDLKKFIVDVEETEESIISKIMRNFSTFDSITHMVKFCLDNGYYSHLRRNYTILCDLFSEYNYRKEQMKIWKEKE